MDRHIARDTHTGRHMLTSNTVRSDVFTAAELARMAASGDVIVLWEYAGRVRTGKDLYVRTRFVGQEDGSLVGYAGDGHLSIIHPADRRIRVITT